MDRRTFLKVASSTLAYSNILIPLNALAASDYQGKFLVNVQVSGGWDVTSLCDPKMNVPGEQRINNWANNDETREAGNIRYAPFANNQAFFEKYYDRMLVINGIDAQTNSHTAGVVHNWSGRLSAGYPTLTSIFSSINGPVLPLSYINNAQYSETGGLTRYSRLDDANTIKNIAYPNQQAWNNREYIYGEEWQRIRQYQDERNADRLASNNITPRLKQSTLAQQQGLSSASLLTSFADAVGAAGQLDPNYATRQAQLIAIAMATGVTIAADISVDGNFDSHNDHDAEHTMAMNNLTNSVDVLWNYAEQYGIADRLVVVISSDFGRTPWYNDTNGKDHWPIGSAIIMEKNTTWGNRMVGYTDSGHNTQKINPNTLNVDATSGTVIHPKHVMVALRKYLGIEQHANALKFPFAGVEEFDLFNASLSTPQLSDPRNIIS